MKFRFFGVTYFLHHTLISLSAIGNYLVINHSIITSLSFDLWHYRAQKCLIIPHILPRGVYENNMRKTNNDCRIVAACFLNNRTLTMTYPVAACFIFHKNNHVRPSRLKIVKNLRKKTKKNPSLRVNGKMVKVKF